MEGIVSIFGIGKDLTVLQMCSRAFVVFIIALLLIRVSGRRSFSFRSPLDNIIAIMLGAVLSRAVVGASPFFPVVLACFLIVVLHRILAWAIISKPKFGKFIEGEKILLYDNGGFIREHMKRALLSEKEVLLSIRKLALTEDLSQIKRIYMEHNGEITVVKK